ncbi:MAG TPA: hypothetical protein DDW76_13045 [Cyanobacteria bacterium UBA11369]|nr:hypothetical protein [Cyanobacteria bacterium UBA11371]HBE31588.1 hypothetical protein [Cyanobacteria bacterium UBA11368]HBE49684.1 hypothetical protein [Cyanobacteria bacterium UBA11369]
MLPKQVEVLVHDNFGGQVEDRYTVVVSSTAANLPPAIAISVNFPLESVHQQLPKKRCCTITAVGVPHATAIRCIINSQRFLSITN